MKILLKLEYFALFVLFFLVQTKYFGNIYYPLLLLLTPDIGMVGYLINRKIGSITYNLTHHQAIGVIFIVAGYLIEFDSSEVLMIIGSVMLTHSFLDRLLGYGLKYGDDFKHTHMGEDDTKK